MMLDLARLRAETPGCADHAHFNHAGASLMPVPVLDAVIGQLRREALEGAMEAGAAVAERVEAARGSAARLLGATPGEIAFATSGSAAWGLAFASLGPLRAGDRILVGRQEWGGNLATMRRAAERAGAQIETIPCDEAGQVSAAALAEQLDERVRLVALTWLPANGGLINPAAAIGQVTRRAGVPYFIDAGQALGQVPVDVAALGCDVLKGAGRKYLRGPRGTALLYVRESFLPHCEPPYLDVVSAPWTAAEHQALRPDARRFETSELPVALLLGLSAAIDYALALGIPSIRRRIDALATDLRERLASIPGVTVRDLGIERSGLVSFTREGMEASEIKARLACQNIAIGANGIAYTPLDMRARGLTAIARASVSYFTSDDEIDHLVNSLRGL
jgi:cysteine desulfurase / selenocysteine lyase